MDYIKKLKEKVLYVLEKNENTRNDDALLTFTIIHLYLPEQTKLIDQQWYVSTHALKRVREDHVKRVRAIIQNEEGKFLPTDPDVRKKRKISEEKWRDYLSTEHKRL